MKAATKTFVAFAFLVTTAAINAEELRSAEQISKVWRRTKSLSSPNTSSRRTKTSKGVELEYVVNAETRQSFDNIHFALDSDQLEGGATFRQLDEIAKAMLSAGGERFLVEGHTCDLGTATYNKDLSERRALTVVKYLMTRGVTINCVQSIGFGSEQPVAPNNCPLNRAHNRRVQIFKLD